ncbi:MAG: hypothetical protein HGB11_12710, partial [Chlorobiales bacterium]|nr:hypothetical protein [Chlorobiales bacterium]
MRRFVILFVMLLCFGSTSLSDALAGNPSPFGRKTPESMFSVGLQPAVIFNHGTFVFFANAGYGITSAIALNTHLGFGSNAYDTYIGGDVRVGLIRSNQVGFDVYLGGHSGGYGSGYDLGAVMNLDIFGALGLVTAIDYDI